MANNDKLQWFVYRYDINQNKIKQFNIFDHASFREEVKTCAKRYKDKDDFSKGVHNSLFYCYWAKCEWEVGVVAWPPTNTDSVEKVDVYSQVMMNWQQFIDYVWEELK